MSQKKVIPLAAECLIPLIACFILSTLLAVNPGDASRAEAEEVLESHRLVRALVIANVTDQVALNDSAAAPVNSAERTPILTPASPSPSSETPAAPTPTELPPSAASYPARSESKHCPEQSTCLERTADECRSVSRPFSTGIILRRSGEYKAHFSYDNKGLEQVSEPVGPNNKFSVPAADIGQPTVFATGRSTESSKCFYSRVE